MTETSNRKLIRTPSAAVDERPFMVIWETTNACDLACRHCRAEAIPDVEPGTLTADQGKRLLDQIETFGRPRPLVIFTGGDPFKRADIFELVAYGSQIGLPIAVSPSGTPLLTRENLSRLKEAGARAISLSLDGSTPALHDDFRRVAGSYQMTLDGWRAGQEVGLRVQLNTTVTRYNLFDLPHIFRLVQELGVMTWSLFFLVPTGRGQADDEIAPAAYEDVMNWLYDAGKLLSIKTTEGHHYKRVVLQRRILEKVGANASEVMGLGDTYRTLNDIFHQVADFQPPRVQEDRIRRAPMHLNAGNGFVFVSRKGEVFPSGFLPLPVGNITESSLVNIYREAPLFQQLRNPDEYLGRCGRCEFRYVCGGSRSRAYAVSGNPLAEEPYCTYVPNSFPYQEELASLLHQDVSTSTQGKGQPTDLERHKP
jgi:AdoMet-dependent heme synthase